jgi:hypothetical protein
VLEVDPSGRIVRLWLGLPTATELAEIKDVAEGKG